MKKDNLTKVQFNQKLLVSDDTGKDLFYVLILLREAGLCDVRTSTEVELPEAGIFDLDIRALDEIYDMVVNHVLNTPGVENLFFSNEVLTKDKKYSESYEVMLEEVLEEQIKKLYTLKVNDCLSPISNIELFKMFKKVNIADLNKDNDIEISREEFEAYLITDNLRDNYLEIYDENLTFSKDKNVDEEGQFIFAYYKNETIVCAIRIK